MRYKKQSVSSTQNLWAWYETRAGARFLHDEQHLLDEALANLFGYHLIQLGCPSAHNLMSASRIGHLIRMDDAGSSHGGNIQAGLQGRAEQLPIASDCIDVVLLPHTLDLSMDPHAVLREVDRILIPEGHVVILGFNPWSAWGLRQFFLRRKRHDLASVRARSALQTQDWLALLGFETLWLRHFCYRPPLNSDTIMNRLVFLERLGQRFLSKLGEAYILVARKKVTTLSVIRPRWHVQRGMMPGRVARPARRGSTDVISE